MSGFKIVGKHVEVILHPPILLCEPAGRHITWAADIEARFLLRVESIGTNGIKVFVWTPPGDPEPATERMIAAVRVRMDVVEYRPPPSSWEAVWPCPDALCPPTWLIAGSPVLGAAFTGVLQVLPMALWESTSAGVEARNRAALDAGAVGRKEAATFLDSVQVRTT